MTVSNDKQAVVQKVFTDFLVQHGHRKTPERMAQYERSYFFGQHDHIIFTDTGEVKEFNDPRIDCIKATIEEEFGIKVARHSLHFYGERCKRGNNFSFGQAKAFVKNSGVS